MSGLSLGGRRIGPGARCYVVADAGRRHGGDVQLGYKLIEIAGAAGADAIGFDRGGQGTEALPDRDFKALVGHARFVGLTLIAAPGDLPAFELVASLDPDAIRLSLGDARAAELLPRAEALGRPLLLRCGRAPAIPSGPAILLGGSTDEMRRLAAVRAGGVVGVEGDPDELLRAAAAGAHLVQTQVMLGGAADLRALVAAVRLTAQDGGPLQALPQEEKTS
jgi:hypothetical protein